MTRFSSLLIFGQLPTMVNEEQLETTATILHVDLDAFYASVEQLLDPPHDPMSDLRKMTPPPLPPTQDA